MGGLGMERQASRRVSVIGVPMDLGADRRGVDMGPSAIRYAGLGTELERLGVAVEDRGNILVPTPESRPKPTEHLKYIDEIAAACRELKRAVAAVVAQGGFPLVLGGDHSIAIGTIAGAATAGPPVGVIWIDAHGDFNTADTSPSGNIHGMPFAVSCGVGDPRLLEARDGAPIADPRRSVLVGARTLDSGEKALIRKAGVTVFTMTDIDKEGMRSIMERSLGIASAGGAGVHISFDLDAIDPTWAPGVGTPYPGGLTYREAHLAMEMAYESGRVASAEFVEVNPILDGENRTAAMAVGLIGSLLGRSIL
jgi:arginase